MRDTDPPAYFLRRAEEELNAAETAASESAAQSHRTLAARYAAIATGSPVHEALKDCENQDGVLPKDFRILP